MHGKMCLFAGLRTNFQCLRGSIGIIACFFWMKWISLSCFLDFSLKSQPKKVTTYNYITLVSSFLLQEGVGAVDLRKRNPTTFFSVSKPLVDPETTNP